MQSLQLRQRDYLLRISRAMTSRQDLPSLLRLILNSAAEMVGGEVGLLVLRQADGTAGAAGDLWLAAGQGSRPCLPG